MSTVIAVGNAATMSSREVADLVESRHDNVKRTIERLSDKGIVRFTPSEETSHEGAGARPIEVYLVNKRDSFVVVAQLCPEFTARLVDRWQELERQAGQGLIPNFSSPAEAARAWAEQYEQRQALQLENQHQSERIDALEALFTPGITPVDFCKKLNGVNTAKVMAYLLDRNWLYNEAPPERSSRWRVASYARDRYLTEKIGKEVKTSKSSFIPHTARLLQAGAIRLYELYRKGDLPMKVDWNGSFTHAKFPGAE
ncbi:phage antirepressor [Aquipseudomonas alcaligenes OT 69]|nr:phage antirepressor [Pseudomonas alcaligenes OT 69]